LRSDEPPQSGRFSRAPLSLPVGLALALCISLAAANGDQTAGSWSAQFQQGYQALRLGHLDEAERDITSLWNAHRGDYELAYAIGTAFDSTGYHRLATGWYQETLRLNPGFAPAYNNLALNRIVQGEPRSALPLLKEATALEPRNAGTFYNLGLVELQLGQYASAAQSFRNAHTLKPNAPDPVAHLAEACFRGGERAEGLRAVAELVQLPGRPAELALLAVRILNSAGLYGEALAEAHAGLRADPSSTALAFQEANALFHLSRYSGAVATLRALRPMGDNRLNYYLLLGSAQALAGDLPGAVTSLQVAVRIAPHEPDGYCRLALIFLKGYRDQDARKVLAQGIQSVPTSPSLYSALGLVNEVDGRYRQGIDDLQHALRLQPHQPGAWAELGGLFAKAGDYPHALAAYRTAKSQGAPASDAVDYADLLLRLGHLTQAKTLLDEVLKQDPDDSDACLRLGEVYEKGGNYVQATKLLERARDLDPDSAEVHILLAQALRSAGQTQAAQQEQELAARKLLNAAQHERRRLLRRVLIPELAAIGPSEDRSRSESLPSQP
jgi:tetratricopeptide (TPR) repeat protein